MMRLHRSCVTALALTGFLLLGAGSKAWADEQAEPVEPRPAPGVGGAPGQQALDQQAPQPRQGQRQQQAPAPQADGGQPPSFEDFSSREDQELADLAFDEMMQEQIPMDPDHIRLWRERIDETQRAIHGDAPAELRSSQTQVDVRPGGEPAEVAIVPGYVSTVRVTDSTGQPWPVTSVSVGNQDWFDVQRIDHEPGNLIRISAQAIHVDTNLLVTLEEHNEPLVVRVSSIRDPDGAVADVMASLQIAGRGPHAAPPMVSSGAGSQKAASSEMISFLDGVPPEGAERVHLDPQPEGVDVWNHDDRYYIRTDQPLVWPAWHAVVRGVADTRVYELPQVPSLILSSEGGSQRHTISH